MPDRFGIGLLGARGHTGRELLRLIAAHPSLRLLFAGSRELAGRNIEEIAPELGPGPVFEDLGPEQAATREADLIVLALPDGVSLPYVRAVEETRPETVLVDISFDHRLDDTWEYGLPELNRSRLAGARRISNPGCYATVMQLALAPMLDRLDGVPAVFGVSGYSGAGSSPGPRNDPERLRDNLMPYRLTGHNHELESIRSLGVPIRFMPHVHPAFRGLLITAHLPLAAETDPASLLQTYQERYRHEALVEVTEATPELRDGAGMTGVVIGGVEVTGRSAVVVGVEDNLLKGAAVQAMQNINLALGLPELTSIGV